MNSFCELLCVRDTKGDESIYDGGYGRQNIDGGKNTRIRKAPRSDCL